MASELLINYRPYETRVALLENGELVEFQLERGDKGAGLLGNVYKGKVVRVIPGLQAAFLDIGLEKAAFLYVDDAPESLSEFSRFLEGERDGESGPGENAILGTADKAPELSPKPPIETLLCEGQELLAQVIKEPIGQKGARVTSRVSLPGRRLVFMDAPGHLGVSKRIDDEEERRRLKGLLETHGEGQGFIARTASEGATAFEIQAEMSFLRQLWKKIQKDSLGVKAPALVYQDLDATLKATRDIFTDQVSRLVIDDRGQFEKAKEFVLAFEPKLLSSVSLYEGPEPLFHAYDVETDLARALNKKVWLKSGGYVVFDSTEALTAIDVNTGRYVGVRNLEETTLTTNLEATREIAYQLRLRNIGGLIVIDFIDMEKESNRERVYAALKELLRRDKGKTKVLPMSELGLMEMTRKRARENIDRLLREPCFYCQGQGFLLSGISLCHQAFRELELAAAEYPGRELTLKVHPALRALILDEGRPALEDLERRLKRPIRVQADESKHLEAYAIEVPQGSPAGPEGPPEKDHDAKTVPTP
ncbi:MAG: Rne/Rng family ribonuclease [Deltaproteobacteria bacterium]|jgi:ribonuclease G|nr:Rne/Rng family ribonuclease [Deltaproteobacteria bacterium]